MGTDKTYEIMVRGTSLVVQSWVPRQAVDVDDVRHQQYWEMVASGSIMLTVEQLSYLSSILDLVRKEDG